MTAFEYQKDDICLFGEHFQRSKIINAEAYPEAWALSDSNDQLTQPSHGFTFAYSQFFTVQATSPQSYRWKKWRKYRNDEMVAMDWWSWEKIYIGAQRFQTDPKEFDCDVLMRAFKDYSHSARRCY